MYLTPRDIYDAVFVEVPTCLSWNAYLELWKCRWRQQTLVYYGLITFCRNTTVFWIKCGSELLVVRLIRTAEPEDFNFADSTFAVTSRSNKVDSNYSKKWSRNRAYQSVHITRHQTLSLQCLCFSTLYKNKGGCFKQLAWLWLTCTVFPASSSQ